MSRENLDIHEEYYRLSICGNKSFLLSLAQTSKSIFFYYSLNGYGKSIHTALMRKQRRQQLHVGSVIDRLIKGPSLRHPFITYSFIHLFFHSFYRHLLSTLLASDLISILFFFLDF